jgi:hypothetical protein
MAIPTGNPYAALFQQYCKELRWAHDLAKERQDMLVRRYMDQQDIDEERARAEVESAHGPLAHNGHVIYVIRKYWLEVAKIKSEMMTKPDGSWIEPLTFLVDDLEEAADDEEDEREEAGLQGDEGTLFELVEMLADLAYWPIGLNEAEEWC